MKTTTYENKRENRIFWNQALKETIIFKYSSIVEQVNKIFYTYKWNTTQSEKNEPTITPYNIDES